MKHREYLVPYGKGSLKRPRRKKRKIGRLLLYHITNWTLAVVSSLLLTAALIMYLCGILFVEPIPQNGATFLYLSVGQANCSVITTDVGNVMIDTGSTASEADVIAYLSYYGVDCIDLLLLTHADEDHSGGLSALLRSVPITRIALTEGTRNALYEMRVGKELKEAVENGETEVEFVAAGTEFRIGDMEISVLTPHRDSAEYLLGDNASSLVLYVKYGETEAVFPGDADELAEKRAVAAMKARYPNAACDILLAGHHGSASSSSAEFLSYLSPKYAVISCERDNSYGHPSHEVLRRFASVGAEVCRIDLDGTVIFHSDGKTITRLR